MKLSKTAICALATSLLTACTSMGSQPQAESSVSSSSLPQVDRSAYRGVQATLDPATGSVETPLDRYVYTPEELALVAAANYFPLKECLLDAGQQPLHHYIDASSKPEFPLGVWSEAYAARYGYEIVTLQGPVLIDEGDANPDDPAVLQAHSDCEAQLRGQEIPYYLHGDTGLGETAILGEVNNQVQSLLLADPDVLAAKEEWLTCLEDQGIAISNENDNIFPLVPDDKELEIEQALKDVACKEKVSLTSRYFDAQAQYEQALIEKNQSAFNTLAEKKESSLEEARRILALNGVSL